MKRIAACLAVMTVIVAVAATQDGLGKSRGGGTGGGQGGPPPPRNVPPRSEPPRNAPPRSEPPRNESPRINLPPRIVGGAATERTPGRASPRERTQGSGLDRNRNVGAPVFRPRDGSSRSGQVQYGTNNNLFDRVNRTEVGSTRITAPSQGFTGSLERRVDRIERTGMFYGGLRVGYRHYDRRWRDDFFWFPHYVFDPFRYGRFYCSPWYFYGHLPPFIHPTRVFIVRHYHPITLVHATVFLWRRDRWGDDHSWDRRFDRWDTSASRLRDALEDLEWSYRRGDLRSIGRLVPRSGRVAILFEGRYAYSLSVDDFYDLLKDGIGASRTLDFEITDVRRGRDHAKVRARHVVEDSWGGSSLKNHTYTLVNERGEWVIREFSTDVGRQ